MSRNLAEVAKEVLLEQDPPLTHLWYGNPQLLHDIAERAGRTRHRHPLNETASVVQSCAKSPLFFRSGEIEHLGRYYPVYQLKDKS